MNKDKRIDVIHYTPSLTGDHYLEYIIEPYCQLHRQLSNVTCSPNIPMVNCKRCILKLQKECKL
jgi:hypothetical protein